MHVALIFYLSLLLCNFLLNFLIITFHSLPSQQKKNVQMERAHSGFVLHCRSGSGECNRTVEKWMNEVDDLVHVCTQSYLMLLHPFFTKEKTELCFFNFINCTIWYSCSLTKKKKKTKNLKENVSECSIFSSLKNYSKKNSRIKCGVK